MSGISHGVGHTWHLGAKKTYKIDMGIDGLWDGLNTVEVFMFGSCHVQHRLPIDGIQPVSSELRFIATQTTGTLSNVVFAEASRHLNTDMVECVASVHLNTHHVDSGPGGPEGEAARTDITVSTARMEITVSYGRGYRCVRLTVRFMVWTVAELRIRADNELPN